MIRHDHSPEVRQTAAQSLYPAARLNSCVEALSTISLSPWPRISRRLSVKKQPPAWRISETPVLHRAIELLEKTLKKDEDESVRVQARISLSVLRNEVWDDIRATSSG